MKLLVTGLPGTGKTTLLKEILTEAKGLSFSGFYTEEVREKGKRIGNVNWNCGSGVKSSRKHSMS